MNEMHNAFFCIFVLHFQSTDPMAMVVAPTTQKMQKMDERTNESGPPIRTSLSID